MISKAILQLINIQFWHFGHSFKGSLNKLYEAKKVMKIGYIFNNHQDYWFDQQKNIFNPWEIEKKGFIVFATYRQYNIVFSNLPTFC